MFRIMLVAAALAATAVPASAQDDAPAAAKSFFQPTETRTAGSVTVHGQRINYEAISGTLVVHAKGWSDNDAIEAEAGVSDDDKSDKGDGDGPKPEASMFYV